MNKKQFKTVVKAFSSWRIDKRRGNYRLPSGCYLSEFLENLIFELLKNNGLYFSGDGFVRDTRIAFNENTDPYSDEQQKQIKLFVKSLIY